MLKNNQSNRICWIMVITTMAIIGLSSSTLAQAGEDDGSQSEGFGFQYEFGDDGSQSKSFGYRYQPFLYQYQPNEEKSDIYGDVPAGLDPEIIRRAEQSRRRSEAEFHQKFQNQINQDIIHRAQQSGRRAAEFYREFQTQTDSSASDFKRLQQQKILEQQQAQQSPAKTTQEKVESPETIEQNQ